MKNRIGTRGFTLIELLLVVAIIGIISGIAIPSFLGQRARARKIGDAQTTAQTLRLALETYKADNGVYGVDGTSYTWTGAVGTTSGSANAALAALLPSFNPGGSQMNLAMQTSNGGLTYKVLMTDPTLGGVVFATDQTGANLPTTTTLP